MLSSKKFINFIFEGNQSLYLKLRRTIKFIYIYRVLKMSYEPEDDYAQGTKSEYSSQEEDDILPIKSLIEEDVDMSEEPVLAKIQSIVESSIFTQQLPLIGKIPMSKNITTTFTLAN